VLQKKDESMFDGVLKTRLKVCAAHLAGSIEEKGLACKRFCLIDKLFLAALRALCVTFFLQTCFQCFKSLNEVTSTEAAKMTK